MSPSTRMTRGKSRSCGSSVGSAAGAKRTSLHGKRSYGQEIASVDVVFFDFHRRRLKLLPSA